MNPPAIDLGALLPPRRLGANLIAAALEEAGGSRNPLETPTIRGGHPYLLWRLVLVAIVAAFVVAVLACGGPVRGGAPLPPVSSDRRTTPDVAGQVEALGPRIVSDAVMVSRWQDYHRTLNGLRGMP